MFARQRVAAWVGAAALLASCLLVAAPAQARWTDVGGSTHYRVCKHHTSQGKGWWFRARVTKPGSVVDARVGLELWRGRSRRATWRSGWLPTGGVARGAVRVHRSADVRVVVWEEAGDRGSPLGTSLVATVRRPGRIGHCPGR